MQYLNFKKNIDFKYNLWYCLIYESTHMSVETAQRFGGLYAKIGA